jgi:hypothetical protein
MNETDRRTQLQNVLAMQHTMLDMAVDWGGLWEFESNAPNGGRLLDFLANLAMSIQMIDQVLKSTTGETIH